MDIQYFDLVNQPFPRKNKFKSGKNINRFAKNGTDYFRFQHGSESFPFIDSAILLATDLQLRSIVESGNNRRVIIGQSSLANNGNVAVDLDRLFFVI